MTACHSGNLFTETRGHYPLLAPYPVSVWRLCPGGSILSSNTSVPYHPATRAQISAGPATSASVSAGRHNPHIEAFYERLRAAGKAGKVARKLLHPRWAAVTRDVDCDPDYGSQTP
jgi:hypothetical protein